MESLKLTTEWLLDQSSQIGEGGLADVYEGTSITGDPVAIKVMKPKSGPGSVLGSDGGEREVQIAKLYIGQSHQHVIPILDAGTDPRTGICAIVMPVAEYSLDEYITTNGPLTEQQAVDVLLAIVTGLVEMGDVVHRDLKPGNVLWHGGQWKVSDFGIARAALAATAPGTMKNIVSCEYSSPEQFRGEHATEASDIYAIGGIAHFLITTEPPFPGPDFADFQLQHTSVTAPTIKGSPVFQVVIANCLRKHPSARPDSERLIKTLKSLRKSEDAESHPLFISENDEIGGAIAAAATLTAEREFAAVEAARDFESRKLLGEGAVEIFNEIQAELMNRLQLIGAAIERGPQANLVDASLGMHLLRGLVGRMEFNGCAWDIIAYGRIGVIQHGSSYQGREASLFYMDLNGSGKYRWYELSYYIFQPIHDRLPPEYSPFAFGSSIDAHRVVQVANGVLNNWGLAELPQPIDSEDQDSFIIRWRNRLAQASTGKLPRPNRFPE